MGQLLAEHGITLVYGGGGLGLMGTTARAALAAGGEVVGIIPGAMQEREGVAESVTELIIVPSMHARKALMERRSDAFLALPGGFGTFEELCEMITWQQLGIHRKPIVLLNTNGYYDPMLAMFDQGVTAGFISPANRTSVISVSNPDEVLQALQGAELPPAHAFLWPDQT